MKQLFLKVVPVQISVLCRQKDLLSIRAKGAQVYIRGCDCEKICADIGRRICCQMGAS